MPPGSPRFACKPSEHARLLEDILHRSLEPARRGAVDIHHVVGREVDAVLLAAVDERHDVLLVVRAAHGHNRPLGDLLGVRARVRSRVRAPTPLV